jgi:hypothetical protein
LSKAELQHNQYIVVSQLKTIMSARGGRGYGGRGRAFQGGNQNQEAASRLAVSKGLTPAIGTYLDFH